MPPASRASTLSPITRWLTWPWRLLMLLGACTALVAVWVALAWSNHSQCSWMALLGALDAAWIVRLAGWPSGRYRALAGLVATAAMVVAANWWIIAVHLGQALGFDPLESALRLGMSHAWLLARLANGGFELAMYAAALLLGWFASR